jgi:hypothetical protein
MPNLKVRLSCHHITVLAIQLHNASMPWSLIDIFEELDDVVVVTLSLALNLVKPNRC